MPDRMPWEVRFPPETKEPVAATAIANGLTPQAFVRAVVGIVVRDRLDGDIIRRGVVGMSADEWAEHCAYLEGERNAKAPPFTERLACLTWQQRAIVARLLRTPGKTVPFGALIASAEDPARMEGEVTVESLRTQLSKARDRMEDAGIPVVVEPVRGIGYRAIVTDPSFLAGK